MPFVIHPRIRKGLGRLAAMTATGVLASTGVAAAASCPTLSTTTPLSQFGDNNSYFVVPGGTSKLPLCRRVGPLPAPHSPPATSRSR